MQAPLSRFVAILLAIAFITNPVLARDGGRLAAPDHADSPENPATPLIIVAPAVDLAHAAARQRVAQSLIDLGRAPDAAIAMANELTEADLAVLGANPDMMQAAGAGGAITRNIIIIALIITGIVLLAVAGSGSASINVH